MKNRIKAIKLLITLLKIRRVYKRGISEGMLLRHDVNNLNYYIEYLKKHQLQFGICNLVGSTPSLNTMLVDKWISNMWKTNVLVHRGYLAPTSGGWDDEMPESIGYILTDCLWPRMIYINKSCYELFKYIFLFKSTPNYLNGLMKTEQNEI